MYTITHKWQKILILGVILLLGLAIRSYNLNSPSIGYHNMKENESLSIAHEMKSSNDYIKKKVYFLNAFEQGPTIKKYGELPLVPYQILISWRLFGENLWGGRLFNVFYALSGIVVIYFLALLLFNNVTLALFCALLLAIMPLNVFFSRNLQAESPAFFFMLLGSLFYLRFASSLKKYNLFLGGLSFSLAWAYRENFLLGILPFAFCLPFKRILLDRKHILRYILAFFIPYLVTLFVVLWFKTLAGGGFVLGLSSLKLAKLLEVFLTSYWSRYGSNILWFAVAENYTVVFSVLALLGILLAFLKGNGLLNRYIIGWVFTIVPFLMLSSEEIYQQSFAQIPFLIMVAISCAYALLFVAQTLNKNIKKEILIYLIIITILIAIPFIYGSIYRMHATVFPGEDVAGETLRELTIPGERVFLLTHPQGYGIARYAQRYVDWPLGFQDFKDKENKFKIRYIGFYPSEYLFALENNSPELFSYIQNNYHIKEVGMLEESGRLAYFILEKGTGQNLKDSLRKLSGQVRPRAIYKLFGRFIFFYTVRPVN